MQIAAPEIAHPTPLVAGDAPRDAQPDLSFLKELDATEARQNPEPSVPDLAVPLVPALPSVAFVINNARGTEDVGVPAARIPSFAHDPGGASPAAAPEPAAIDQAGSPQVAATPALPEMGPGGQPITNNQHLTPAKNRTERAASLPVLEEAPPLPLAGPGSADAHPADAPLSAPGSSRETANKATDQHVKAPNNVSQPVDAVRALALPVAAPAISATPQDALREILRPRGVPDFRFAARAPTDNATSRPRQIEAKLAGAGVVFTAPDGPVAFRLNNPASHGGHLQPWGANTTTTPTLFTAHSMPHATVIPPQGITRPTLPNSETLVAPLTGPDMSFATPLPQDELPSQQGANTTATPALVTSHSLPPATVIPAQGITHPTLPNSETLVANLTGPDRPSIDTVAKSASHDHHPLPSHFPGPAQIVPINPELAPDLPTQSSVIEQRLTLAEAGTPVEPPHPSAQESALRLLWTGHLVTQASPSPTEQAKAAATTSRISLSAVDPWSHGAARPLEQTHEKGRGETPLSRFMPEEAPAAGPKNEPDSEQAVDTRRTRSQTNGPNRPPSRPEGQVDTPPTETTQPTRPDTLPVAHSMVRFPRPEMVTTHAPATPARPVVLASSSPQSPPVSQRGPMLPTEGIRPIAPQPLAPESSLGDATFKTTTLPVQASVETIADPMPELPPHPAPPIAEAGPQPLLPASPERPLSFGFDAAAALRHGAAPRPATGALLAKSPIQQASTALSVLAPDQPGRIELMLAPESLGRLHFDMRPDGASLSITLSAEHPETLDLMRRHLPELLAELKQAGVQAGTLSFGSWSDGRHPPLPANPGPEPELADQLEMPLIPALPQRIPSHAPAQGLDLRL